MIALILSGALLFGLAAAETAPPTADPFVLQPYLSQSESCLGQVSPEDLTQMQGVKWACWVGSTTEIENAMRDTARRLIEAGWIAAEPLHFMAGFWRQATPERCEQIVVAVIPPSDSAPQTAAMLIVETPLGECRGVPQ